MSNFGPSTNSQLIARLRPSWARVYPSLHVGEDYRVLRKDEHVEGYFLDLGGREQYVDGRHFEVAEAISPHDG